MHGDGKINVLLLATQARFCKLPTNQFYILRGSSACFSRNFLTVRLILQSYPDTVWYIKFVLLPLMRLLLKQGTGVTEGLLLTR
jgi:hypothetical protein